MFTVLVWGPVTDVIGRRRAMVLVPLINAMRALVYLVNAYYVECHVGYLLFGSFLSCFYGEFQGVVALCYAYLADITSNHLDQRTMRMAFVEASLFFAGIPSGLLSGYLLQRLGFVSVFGLNIGINACILAYVVFYLPKDDIASNGGGMSEDKLSSGYQKFGNDDPSSSNSNITSPSAKIETTDRAVLSPANAASNDSRLASNTTSIIPGQQVIANDHRESKAKEGDRQQLSSPFQERRPIITKRSRVTGYNDQIENLSTTQIPSGSSNDVNRDISCGTLFNPFSHLYHVFKVVTSPSCRRVVIPVILSFGLSVCAVYGELVVQTLYLTNQPFAFRPQTIGYYSAVQSGLRGCGVILMTQLSYRIFRLSDYTLITVGILSQILCYVSIGVARTPLTVFLVNIAGVGIPVATTTLRSLATKNVSTENYGAVLASLEATDALAGVLTNASTLWTYNLTLHVYSGIAFFALAGFSFFSLIFLGVAFSLRSR